MARTKSGTLLLSSDSTGLYAEATLNPSRPDVQIVRAAIQDGDMDEMSFAFRATKQSWNEDYSAREIQGVNLHQGDVSVVNYGANRTSEGCP
jgi:HK97 family phage prohead protease